METTITPNAASVQIFKNPAFGQMRVQSNEKGQAWFCLSDVCQSLGLGNASQTKTRLKAEGIITNYTPTKSGTQQMLFIDEPNLYRCIFQSRKKEAEAFQDWVVEEVLPTIRKTGGYIPADEGESEADIMAKALLIAQRQIEAQRVRAEYEAARAEALQKQTVKMQGQIDYINEKQKKLIPAAAYANEVLQSKSDYTLTQTAHALGLRSVHVLTKWLKRIGVLYFQSGQWQPTAKVADKGYFTTRTCKYVNYDDTVGTKIYTTVTERGRRFLWEMLNDEEGAL
jgi:prophage antirepressor-like protein